MKIETKYNRDDKLYFVNDNKINYGLVKSINITHGTDYNGANLNTTIHYEMQTSFLTLQVFEGDLYKEKEDLISVLSKDIQK